MFLFRKTVSSRKLKDGGDASTNTATTNTTTTASTSNNNNNNFPDAPPAEVCKKWFQAADEGNVKQLRKVRMKVGPFLAAKDDQGRTALHIACYRGHAATVDYLLQEQDNAAAEDESETGDLPPPVNLWTCVDDIQQRTALHFTVQHDRATVQAKPQMETRMMEVLEVILLHPQSKSLLNLLDLAGQTMLHMVAREGHAQALELLLDKTRKSAALDWMIHHQFNGNTALHEACQMGHVPIVQLLLQAAKQHEQDHNQNDEEDDHHGVTDMVLTKNNQGHAALHTAAAHEQLAVVQVLLEQCPLSAIDVDLDALETSLEIRDLITAVRDKKLGTTTTNTNTKKENSSNSNRGRSREPGGRSRKSAGRPSARRSTSRSSSSNFKLDGSASKLRFDGSASKLDFSASKLDADALDQLQQPELNVMSALPEAGKNGNLSMVKKCLKLGQQQLQNQTLADLIHKARESPDNRSVLDWACVQGHVEIVRYLVKKSNGNLVDLSYTPTPLHWACWGTTDQRWDIVDCLLQSTNVYLHALSNLNGQTEPPYEKTALHLACQRGDARLVQTLLPHHIKDAESSSDVPEWTPLHEAAYHNQAEIVQILLEIPEHAENSMIVEHWKNADDNNNQRALECAEDRGHKQIANMLRQAMGLSWSSLGGGSRDSRSDSRSGDSRSSRSRSPSPSENSSIVSYASGSAGAAEDLLRQLPPSPGSSRRRPAPPPSLDGEELEDRELQPPSHDEASDSGAEPAPTPTGGDDDASLEQAAAPPQQQDDNDDDEEEEGNPWTTFGKPANPMGAPPSGEHHADDHSWLDSGNHSDFESAWNDTDDESKHQKKKKKNIDTSDTLSVDEPAFAAFEFPHDPDDDTKFQSPEEEAEDDPLAPEPSDDAFEEPPLQKLDEPEATAAAAAVVVVEEQPPQPPAAKLQEPVEKAPPSAPPEKMEEPALEAPPIVEPPPEPEEKLQEEAPPVVEQPPPPPPEPQPEEKAPVVEEAPPPPVEQPPPPPVAEEKAVSEPALVEEAPPPVVDQPPPPPEPEEKPVSEPAPVEEPTKAVDQPPEPKEKRRDEPLHMEDKMAVSEEPSEARRKARVEQAAPLEESKIETPVATKPPPERPPRKQEVEEDPTPPVEVQQTEEKTEDSVVVEPVLTMESMSVSEAPSTDQPPQPLAHHESDEQPLQPNVTQAYADEGSVEAFDQGSVEPFDDRSAEPVDNPSEEEPSEVGADAEPEADEEPEPIPDEAVADPGETAPAPEEEPKIPEYHAPPPDGEPIDAFIMEADEPEPSPPKQEDEDSVDPFAPEAEEEDDVEEGEAADAPRPDAADDMDERPLAPPARYDSAIDGSTELMAEEGDPGATEKVTESPTVEEGSSSVTPKEDSPAAAVEETRDAPQAESAPVVPETKDAPQAESAPVVPETKDAPQVESAPVVPETKDAPPAAEETNKEVLASPSASPTKDSKQTVAPPKSLFSAMFAGFGGGSKKEEEPPPPEPEPEPAPPPKLTVGVMESILVKESLLLDSVGHPELVDNSNLSSVFDSLENPNLRRAAFETKGHDADERKDIEIVQSNRAYWEFYLALLERARSQIRAIEVIAGGSQEGADSFRQTAVSTVRSRMNTKGAYEELLASVCKRETVSASVKSLAASSTILGASLAGNLVEKLDALPSDVERHTFAGRLLYFVALSEICDEGDGALDGVLERATRMILWSCEHWADLQQGLSTEHLSWWRRQGNRMAGAPMDTLAQDDGYQGAECIIDCIMNPKPGTELHEVLLGEKFEFDPWSLHEILVAASLALPLETVREYSVQKKMPPPPQPDVPPPEAQSRSIPLDFGPIATVTSEEMDVPQAVPPVETVMAEARSVGTFEDMTHTYGDNSSGEDNDTKDPSSAALREQNAALHAKMMQLEARLNKATAVGIEDDAISDASVKHQIQESVLEELLSDNQKLKDNLREVNEHGALLEDRIRQLEKMLTEKAEQNQKKEKSSDKDKKKKKESKHKKEKSSKKSSKSEKAEKSEKSEKAEKSEKSEKAEKSEKSEKAEKSEKKEHKEHHHHHHHHKEHKKEKKSEKKSAEGES